MNEVPRFHEYPFYRPSATEIPPIYRQLRAEEPAARVKFPSGDEGWVVSRYEDVYQLLADPRFSRQATSDPAAPRVYSARPVSGGLFTMDPPEHTRLRKLVSREFTSRRIHNLRPRIQELTDRLLDDIAQREAPVDLIENFAFPLPVQVICELLGVPYQDHEQFQKWSAAIVSLTSHTPDEALENMAYLAGYFEQLIADKRAELDSGEGGDDLLSALISVRDEQEKLNEHELMMMGMTLLVAGHETSATVIGSGILTLLRHPEVMRRLQQDPELLEPTVEEILRTNPIGDGGPLRVTLEDVTVAGVTIPANSAVIAAIPPTNHDEQQFSDPETFDVDRPDNRHLAFGHGVHYCIGAALARAEVQITVETLLRRFPSLQLAESVENLSMTSGMMVHHLRSLPVTW